MKLFVVIHSLRWGGSERVLVNLLNGLDRKRFSITLVLYEKVFDYAIPENIDLKLLDIYTGRNLIVLAKSFILKIINLTKLIKQNKPDVIFSLLSTTNVTVILAKLLSRVNCRLIVSEHTHPSENLKNEPYGFLTKFLVKQFYPKANKVVAVSSGIKEDLIKNFNVPEKKIAIIYNPIDINNIRMLSEEHVDHPWFRERIPIIVSVGRLTRQKGFPYLLKAFSILRKSFYCRLLIIGDGEERESLIKMAEDSGYRGDIEFIGFQKNPFKYMAKASIFVLSSIFEGFGNVIVEAMALGLPVISTDCPSGPSEIIENGESGLLVPVRDEYALADSILDVLTNNELREKLIKGARKRAETFTMDKVIKYYTEVFCENPSSSL